MGRKKLVMCQVCRGLIEASVKTCPLCGRESIPAARISAGSLTSGHFISLVVLTINILLFVLMSIVEVQSGRGAESFVQSASGPVLYDFGALVPSMVTAGQWWRLITCNFLHIGLMHLMFNSSALFMIGPQVEDIYGSQKFAFIYLATGIASAVASYLLLPAGSAGASGAIFGLIGLMAAYGYRLGGRMGRDLMTRMLVWAAIGIAFGFVANANNVAHVGGFIAGALLAFLLTAEHPTTTRTAAVWNATAIACIGLVAIGFVFAGRVYGTAQEQRYQARKKAQQAPSAIQLIMSVEKARSVVEDTRDIETTSGRDSRNYAQQAAANLRSAASDLEKAPDVDQRGGELKRQLIDLLGKRARSFNAVANDSMLVEAANTEIEALGAVFRGFEEWSAAIVGNYQSTSDRD
jgi:membrane associated rhomboid family serine protease